MYQAVKLALNHRNKSYEFKTISLQEPLVYSSFRKRGARSVNSRWNGRGVFAPNIPLEKTGKHISRKRCGSSAYHRKSGLSRYVYRPDEKSFLFFAAFAPAGGVWDEEFFSDDAVVYATKFRPLNRWTKSTTRHRAI
jgi:hypothetical protein